MARTDLFDEFDAISAKAWKQKILFELDGADYTESLVYETLEGIKIKPFYTSEDLQKKLPDAVHRGQSWKIAQHIYAANAKMANRKALAAVENGTESLIITLPSEAVPLEEVLRGVPLESTSVHCNPLFLSTSYNKLTSDTLPCFFYTTDCIGQLARTGNWFYNEARDMDLMAQLHHRPNTVASVDGTLYQNAGANRIQQLAYVLAHAHEYLHLLEQKKTLAPNGTIIFKIAVDSNYFLEIAKLRALRCLWDSVACEYGILWDCHIVAIPTKRNKTIYSYNTNMLRTTMECMAAVVGGANTISNLAYDALYHKENGFGERIARNQLLLLKHESYFDAVNNPADGSYYIESLTREMAEKGLELFKSIEKGGGFLAQLKSQTIQKKIKESHEKEQLRFTSEKEILVGTNRYRVELEKMKGELELFPFVKTNPRKTLIEPIIERRLAETNEQKRLSDE